MSETIYRGDFARYLPQALANDPKITALAEVAAEELRKVSELAKNVMIYPRINELNEELLDILAYDMHIDWYNYDYPIEIKRAIIQNSVRVHQKLGTKYAVETALRDVYKSAKVEEWFEYGGKPYCFRIHVDIGNMGLKGETDQEIEEKMKFYKNLRSHCDSITYGLGVACAQVYAGASARMGMYLKINLRSRCDSITYRLGAACVQVYAGASARTGMYLKIKEGEGGRW